MFHAKIVIYRMHNLAVNWVSLGDVSQQSLQDIQVFNPCPQKIEQQRGPFGTGSVFWILEESEDGRADMFLVNFRAVVREGTPGGDDFKDLFKMEGMLVRVELSEESII